MIKNKMGRRTGGSDFKEFKKVIKNKCVLCGEQANLIFDKQFLCLKCRNPNPKPKIHKDKNVRRSE